MSMFERLSSIQEKIHTLAPSRPVTLVAVSKYASIQQMLAAYELGIRDFGENKVQEALAKIAQFPAEYQNNINWHLIGTLQSNKVKKTVGHFQYIHSVDSAPLAQTLAKANQATKITQPILLQVNLSADPNRHGFQPNALAEALDALLPLSGIAIKGFMGMAPPEASLHGDSQELVRIFSGLRDTRDRLAQQYGIDLPELSMGMSQDYTQALICGATIIRIGNYLFKN